MMRLRWSLPAAAAVGLAFAVLSSGAEPDPGPAPGAGNEAEAKAEAGAPEAAPAAKAVEIPMRDGKRLVADLYLPGGAGPGARFPTILIQTPYNRAVYSRPGNEHAGKALTDREHYAYVILDWRGFYGSKAAGSAMTGRQRGQDGYDAVEWIAKQEWSDGKVGTWGASALGQVQYDTAAARPPHLVCCVPIVAGFGQSYDGFYGGGVFRKAYADNMRLVGWGMIAGFAEKHPLRDRFWTMAESTSNYGVIDVPMLLVTGWSDHGADKTLATFRRLRSEGGERARTESRLLVGPWEHSGVDDGALGEMKFPKAQGEAARVAALFFGYWLRGEKDNGLAKLPAVRWYQTGADAWREADAWPPAGRVETALHFAADGRLAMNKPDGEASGEDLRYDPADPSPTVGGANFVLRVKALAAPNQPAAGSFDQRAKVESRRDCLVHTTAPLEQPLAFAGNVRTKFFVSTDRADLDVAVRLCDVWPDGRSMLVTDGIRRLSLRESFEKSSPVKPGEVYELVVELPAAGHTFARGHRVRVDVTASNHPRFALNPGAARKSADGQGAGEGGGQKQAGMEDKDAPPVAGRIWFGGERASALVLPTMPEAKAPADGAAEKAAE